MVFKIRNKETGLYSTGGRYASWSEKGKIWDTKESAQKAVSWYNTDEQKHYENRLEDYQETLKRVVRHNKKIKTAKRVDGLTKWNPPSKPPSARTFEKNRFYKDAEIVGYSMRHICGTLAKNK